MTNLNDSGAGSLRGTIAGASSGDTIRFALTGTIVLTSGTLVMDKNLTIEGPGGPAVLVISRSIAAGAPRFRLMESEGKTVSLTGLTLTQGFATDEGGGAYRNYTGSLTARNCVFSNNTAQVIGATNPPPDSGGAIHNTVIQGYDDDQVATLVVQDCVFSGNSCSESGGAVGNSRFILSGGDGLGTITATVERCTFTGNSAISAGGGFYHGLPGSVTVSHSVFQNNTAGSLGGGLHCSAPLTLESSTFENNSAVGSGGALRSGDGTVQKCLFTRNQAEDGGAVASGGATTVEACTFHENNARGTPLSIFGKGGAILHTSTSGLTVTGCTMTGNLARSGAHSIHKTIAATAVLIRSTIIGGTAAVSQQHLGGEGAFSSEGYNLCADVGGGFLTAAGDQINTLAHLDPLGPQDHSGSTKTIALLSISPALDRGKAFGLTTDQREANRVFDLAAHANAAGGDSSDIGAFEATEPLASPLVVTTLLDHDDGVAGESDCTLREAIKRANALGGASSIFFLPGLQGTVAVDRTLGALVITSRPQITGPGARLLAVSTGGYMRVFHFSGSLSGGTLSGLTIRDGYSGGIPATAAAGGGVYNEGFLSFNDCAFEAHTATGGNATTVGGHGSDGSGGGIFNAGSLTLNRCTFTGCLAAGGYPQDDPNVNGRGGNAGSGRGAAVYHAGTSLTVNQCTFQGNNASGAPGANGANYGGNGGSGQGGAIFRSQGAMSIAGSTLSGNFSFGGSAGHGSLGIFDGLAGTGSGAVTALTGGSAATVHSTVIAGNVRNGNFPADVAGAFASAGYNLLGSAGTATGFTPGTDQKGTNAAPLNPLLGPLQNNGGQTNTMSPLAGSPLIDKGRSSGFTSDQRGVPRPLDALSIPNAAGGDASDIGAVETDVAQTGPVFVVNSLDDHDNGATYVDCTLREALNAANLIGGADTVMFQPGLTGTIALNSALGTLSMYDAVTLIGPGARRLALVQPTGGVGRILLVQGGPHFVSGLTLYGGTLTGNTGGQSVQGAGILSQGVLTVSDCTITRNIATAGDNNLFTGQPGGSAFGGGVANTGGGSLTLNRCTFSLNSIYGGRGWNTDGTAAAGPGGYASGGAVFNDTGCTLTAVNCTFSDNTATGGSSGNSDSFTGDQGGAAQGVICNRGNMTLTAITLRGGYGTGGASGFTFPRGTGAGGLFAAAGSTSLVRNTLCAANLGNFVASDIIGAFTSGGFNLIGNGDTGTGFTAATDQKGTTGAPLNARFGVSFNYGGPTETVALQSNSPALDRGMSFGLATDQRGAARTYNDPALANAAGGDGTDIGAFETVPAYGGPPDFVNITRAGSAMLLQLQGEAAVLYQLQFSSDIVSGFVNTGSPVRADNLGLVDFIDPGLLPDRQFYRAIRNP